MTKVMKCGEGERGRRCGAAAYMHVFDARGQDLGKGRLEVIPFAI